MMQLKQAMVHLLCVFACSRMYERSFITDKVWLKATTSIKKINIFTYFENLRLHIIYVLNTHQILYQSDVIYYLIH